MSKHRKYKARPMIIDRTPNPKMAWDILDFNDIIICKDNKYYILYNELYLPLLEKLKRKNESTFSGYTTIESKNERYQISALEFNTKKDAMRFYYKYINYIKEKYTLWEAIYKIRKNTCNKYKRIIVYNDKDEVISCSYCSFDGEEVHDTRNDHGVPVAKARSDFWYNFLTKTLKHISLKLMKMKISVYINSDFDLKIRLHEPLELNKMYREIDNHIYKKKPLKKVSHKPSKETLKKLKKQKKEERIRRAKERDGLL